MCVNAANQPPGGELVEGESYEAEDQFVNNADQCAYIIKGINNTGKTKFGFSWKGYRCERFLRVDGTKETKKEVEYSMN